jgi:YHS domain-containing protein
MTARRQERKGPGCGWAGAALLAATVALGAVPQAWAAATERVVVNRHSGLAIDGFDPVAYFTEGAPRPGVAEVETWQGGVVWRFCSEANRAAFLSAPDIYAPRFGGYDPVQVAHGTAVAGRPQLWLVAGERLYLFSREDNRAAFAADPDGLRAQAEAQWPAVRDGLADY